ncbi:hypothetical protein [Parasedimentitalea denitrificans]|nr:hypothetical protein [Sedimentitalea sp. CY04]
MFVKVNETRHTKVGTLRTGTILDVGEFGPKGRAVIEALLAQDDPAVVKLTKEQVEAEKDAVVSLVPVDDPEDETSIDLDVLGDLQKTLSDAKKLNTKLQEDLEQAISARDEGAEKIKYLQDERTKITADRDGLAETSAEEANRADAAENEVKTLKADLEKAQKALTDAIEKSGGDKK